MKIHRRHMTLILAAMLSMAWIVAPVLSKEIPSAEPQPTGMSAKKLAEVDKVMTKLVADRKIAGGIVIIAHKGKIVLFNNYGKRDAAANKPMEKDTIVRIYSMTKAITTAAALTLYDEGKLDPEAPVARYLPAFKNIKVHSADGLMEQASPMKVADLMRHTAGMVYGWGGSAVDKAYQKTTPLESKNLDEFTEKMAKLPLLYDPGSDWQYSVSIDVLGAVIEKVAGMPLDAFLAKRIFEPLDMKDTGFHVPKDKIDRFAVNYSHDKDGNLVVRDAVATSKYVKPATFFSGGGGLVGTARDYMRFLMMVQNDGELHGVRILKKDTVKLMKTNQLPKAAFPIRFGKSIRHGTGFSFGFSVRTANTKWDPAGRLGEYGWGGAASTHYWVSPKDDLIVVTLEQRMPYTFETEFLLKGVIYGAIDRK